MFIIRAAEMANGQKHGASERVHDYITCLSPPAGKGRIKYASRPV